MTFLNPFTMMDDSWHLVSNHCRHCVTHGRSSQIWWYQTSFLSNLQWDLTLFNTQSLRPIWHFEFLDGHLSHPGLWRNYQLWNGLSSSVFSPLEGTKDATSAKLLAMREGLQIFTSCCSKTLFLEGDLWNAWAQGSVKVLWVLQSVANEKYHVFSIGCLLSHCVQRDQ